MTRCRCNRRPCTIPVSAALGAHENYHYRSEEDPRHEQAYHLFWKPEHCATIARHCDESEVLQAPAYFGQESSSVAHSEWIQSEISAAHVWHGTSVPFEGSAHRCVHAESLQPHA